ncbi:MAG: SDR family NAD(P)-dependent oxidoreductase, partial [archaeon]|nr:SDR family NAD(P)-dependent oxidoreductase [archaeon]
GRDERGLAEAAARLREEFPRGRVGYAALDLGLLDNGRYDEALRRSAGPLLRGGGRLAAVACCAGGGPHRPAGICGAEELTRAMNVNALGGALVVQRCLPLMDPGRRGGVVMLASLEALGSGLPGTSAYHAAKAAVLGYCRTLFQELRSTELRVCCLCPGLVDTPLGAAICGSSAGALSPSADSPLGPTRLRPAVVADAAFYAATGGGKSCVSEIVLLPLVTPLSVHLSSLQTAISHPSLQIERPSFSSSAASSTIPWDGQKACIVTGGSAGIGLGIARRLHRHGWSVVLVARAGKRLDEAVASMKGAVAVAMDLGDDSGFARYPEAAKEMVAAAGGRADALVLSAGTNRRRHSMAADPAVWDQLVALNMRSVMTLTSALLPALVASRGHVVFVSSTARHLAARTDVGLASYFATKSALAGFANVLRTDVGPFGVKVGTVSPDITNTALGQKKGPSAWANPSSEWVQVEDCAEAAEFILSVPDASVAEVFLYPQAHSLAPEQDLARRCQAAIPSSSSLLASL